KVELPVEHVQVKVDAKIYANYVGQYELAPTFVLTITTEGEKIYSQATNQSKIEIFPESETSFFLRVVEATLTFEKGPDGKVTGLVLHQNGRHTPGKRLP
ncbi:MAG: DUF3471 domain-containing protein, partial [Acidobacteria bacterium]|nr:DUF3471 domain-containing protein [Acidobacteriota bacterium]